MFKNADIIDVYSRKQAIEDGFQVKMEGEQAQLAREAGYKWPVYITNGVWGLVERAINNKRWCNDLNGVLWDIFYMSRVAGRNITDRLKVFQVIITGTGKKRKHRMFVETGPVDFDDPAPCLTFMLPEEN